jgi:phage terminase large subunit GpA-like protein
VTHADPAAVREASLADLKAERERLLAQRAQRELAEAEAASLRAPDVLRAGLAMLAEARAVLEQLEAVWALDVAGQGDETAVHHAMSRAAHQVLSGLARLGQQPDAALPEVGAAFARGATPRRLLTVSQWAAQHRYLVSGTNSPGQWRNELTPYLTEIMDALSEHSPVRQVTFIKSSGVGGTEVMFNWLGYVMHHLQNRDMLVVLPTLELRDRSFNPRFGKLLEETPVLTALAPTAQRNRSNRGDLLEYGGRTRVIKAGANSPDSLRSDHLPYVICDEVSAFPWDVGGEGDPMTLIDNRQRTYSRAKTYLVSTPTREGACRIAQQYARSDRRRYYVPCPHCEETQPLEFGGAEVPHGLKWRTAPPEPGQADVQRVLSAWYVCKHCGAEIAEKHKPDMLARGRWVAERPQVRLHRGYHINALYAPVGLGLGWKQVAEKWLAAQGDSSELKAFVNTYLGEVWREEGDELQPQSLLSRLEPVDRAGLPPVIIVAGVDVQKDRLEATVAAISEREEAWVLDHVIVPGDTNDAQTWLDLEEQLVEAGVQACAVDSGFNTGAVYDFVRARAWCTATKGIPGAGRPFVEDEKRRRQRLRQRRRRGVHPEPVGTDQGKTLLYARLKMEVPGPGYIHFAQNAAFDDEYFAQLAAERLERKLKGHRPFLEWVQLRPRNEALDCLLLCLVAARLHRRGHQRRDGASVTVVAGAPELVQPDPRVPAPAVPRPAPAAPARVNDAFDLASSPRFGARRK